MSNVREFGAAGDGRRDDTAAILHAVHDGDGSLEFPPGDYRITRPIELDLTRPRSFALHGAGAASRLIMAGPGPAIIAHGPRGAAAIGAIEIAGAHPEADGIAFEDVTAPALGHLRIREVRTGITARRTNQWALNGSSISGSGHNLHLVGCRTVAVAGNVFCAGLGGNVVIEQSQNVTLGPNAFDHFADYDPYEAWTAVRLEECIDCVLSGFVIRDGRPNHPDPTQQSPDSWRGLVELASCRRLNVSGVQLLDAASCGMRLDECRETLVSGCTILDGRTAGGMQAAIHWGGEGCGNLITGCRLGSGLTAAVVAASHVRQWNNLPG